MAKNIRWTREQQLLVFRLYCRTPFGRLHRSNPEIITLSTHIGRTPSAIAMKACNFASLDPGHQARNIRGLGNTSRADRELWDEFTTSPNAIVQEAENAYARITGHDTEVDGEEDTAIAPERTESEQTIRVRRAQRFFRAAVLVAYDYRCALTGISVPALLNASHIIPWHANESRRTDPRNGLCLNTLHDRAFDRGLITFDDSLRVVVSPLLKCSASPEFHRIALLDIEGKTLHLPERFQPDRSALAYHRDHVYRDT